MLRRISVLTTLTVVSMVLVGCDDPGGVPGGGGEEVDITGKTPAEAAHIVADALCNWYAECGMMSIECRSTPNGTGTECSGEIVPIPHNACYESFIEEIQQDFECADMSTETQQLVSMCMTAYVSQECYTQQDLDRIIAEMESGEGDGEFVDLPPECMQMGTVFGQCQTTSVESTPRP